MKDFLKKSGRVLLGIVVGYLLMVILFFSYMAYLDSQPIEIILPN